MEWEMTRHLLVAAGFAALALTACSAVPAPKPGPADASLGVPKANKLAGYFASNPIDGAALLGPPPSPDSLRGQADRQRYEETRALAGSPRWIEATKDDDIWGGGALRRYSCALGVKLGDKETPAVSRLLHRIELDVRTVGTPPKDFYNRTRPLIGDDKPVCVARADWMKTNASYPSGHSMTGWSWSLVLSEIAPDKADGLLAAGKTIGESRVICGVHFQSDVEAGRTLAAAMVAKLHAQPQFETDLAAAKAELARTPRAADLSCPTA
jgi:acid phosphatase (class A)